jgi:hypothetical protein
MTCQVVGMNKLGIAVAVDSAVSFIHNGKAYHSAEKLFPLNNGETPVAIATFGVAETSGVPWDVIIHGYSARLGTTRFDTLDEYCSDFFAYVEGGAVEYSTDEAAYRLAAEVSRYWGHGVSSVCEAHGTSVADWTQVEWESMKEWICEDEGMWNYGTMPGFPDDFGAQVVGSHGADLEGVAREMFNGKLPPPGVWQGMLVQVERMYSQDWVSRADASGLVFMGFGEGELFPRIEEFLVGPHLLGRVRRIRRSGGGITFRETGTLHIYGEGDSANSFILGVAGDSLQWLRDSVVASVLDAMPEDAPDGLLDVDSVAAEVVGRYLHMMHVRFRVPLVDAVSAMPLKELAALARMLVDITAARSQIAATETGTVGGDIRVATITRHAGLLWQRPADIHMGRQAWI